MGMYDYIKCERMLPDGLDGSGLEFQTKDTDDQYMHTYTITDKGRLVVDKCHYESVPKSERPFPDAKEGSLKSFMGCMRRVVDTPDVDQNYHGYLRFYTDVGGKWHEYIAKFTDGTMMELVATEEASN